VYDPRWLAMGGMCRHDHRAEGVGSDGTAGMPKAAGTDLHDAIGQAMVEEPADTLDDVEGGGL
jgi:hypothetical protein